MNRFALGTTFALLFASTALAGPQYVDESGFAVSGYDVVAYHALEQNALGTGQPEAVPGSTEFTAEHNGATWAFASAENRDRFLAEPDKYAPAYDGHCAYGVAKGGKVPANPNLWRIVDGVLYLNINPAVVSFWEEDIPGYIETSEQNWTGVETEPASERSWKSIKTNDDTYTASAPIGG
ncbi:MAG: YHS domain-containing (seleno)protein [Pseudomonadota bacterium]